MHVNAIDLFDFDAKCIDLNFEFLRRFEMINRFRVKAMND